MSFMDRNQEAATMHNLAATLTRLAGPAQKAEQLFQQLVQLRRRVLRGNHPSTALTLNRMAEMNRTQKRCR